MSNVRKPLREWKHWAEGSQDPQADIARFPFVVEKARTLPWADADEFDESDVPIASAFQSRTVNVAIKTLPGKPDLCAHLAVRVRQQVLADQPTISLTRYADTGGTYLAKLPIAKLLVDEAAELSWALLLAVKVARGEEVLYDTECEHVVEGEDR